MTDWTPEPGWRQTHTGLLLRRALARFDARVLQLMAANEALPLGLSNLAARGQLAASQAQITRHLPTGGARLSELAALAGISKQAMGKLVDQCAAWGLVERGTDLLDARACWIRFTPVGVVWLAAFEAAVRQAEAELRQVVGAEVATVVTLGLEAYTA